MRTFILLIAALAPLPAAAQDFDCRNTEAEIRCQGGKCEVESEGFTPMQLSRKGGKLSLCAYSGCWEGPILVRRSRGQVDLLYAELRSTRHDTPAGGDLAVIYDRREQVAQMRWGGFSNAMACE
jgi:hypothetical protein